MVFGVFKVARHARNSKPFSGKGHWILLQYWLQPYKDKRALMQPVKPLSSLASH